MQAQSSVVLSWGSLWGPVSRAQPFSGPVPLGCELHKGFSAFIPIEWAPRAFLVPAWRFDQTSGSMAAGRQQETAL